MHRHNIVLPIASLGASGTVRNEATSDARRFHENPRFILEHIKVQVPTAVPTFGLFSPISGGRTQSNRRTLSHQTSSTRWTPPTWCWLLSTAIGTFCCEWVFISVLQSGWNPTSWALLLPSINSSFLHSAGLTFVSVHDCYWTHALTVDTMNKVSVPSLALIYPSLPSTSLTDSA